MSTTNTRTATAFCPVRFKETTRAQWQEAADAWHRWGPLLGEWLGEATELMLDLGNVGKDDRVLDVAAGAGEQSLTAARRVGPGGTVLATDLSSNILRLAREAARSAGLDNVQVKELDGEKLGDLAAESFDTVISRVGMIYFPDQLKALQGMRHTLVPGGKVSLITYAAADKNQFFSLPVSIIRKRANLPAPQPGQPGPFSLGDPVVLQNLLTEAGFSDVVVRSVNAPVRVKTAAECVQFEQESFGALHQMLSSLDESEQESVWDEIATALDRFETADGFEGPCELLVAAGTK